MKHRCATTCNSEGVRRIPEWPDSRSRAAPGTTLCGHGDAGAFDAECAICGRFLRTPSPLARNDVFSVPLRPVVLRSGRFVLAMTLLCFLEKLGQRHHVQAEPATRKSSLDLLKEPAVPVRITK